jgi:predicted O-methyltransferase YrrM
MYFTICAGLLETDMTQSEIDRPDVQEKLNALHLAAAGDKWRIAQLMLRSLPRLLLGKKPTFLQSHEAKALAYEDIYIPIDPDEGMILYAYCRSNQAKRIIEFGSSFGISSIYLTAAIIDNGGGQFVGSELDPKKCNFVNDLFSDLGWSDTARIIPGDALQTFKTVGDKWDVLFLDGWKEFYLDIVELMEDRIREGGMVIAADVDKFKDATAPCVRYLYESPAFDAMKLQIGDGWILAVK